MANCINYNCTDDIGNHVPNTCGEELLGGSSQIILLECNSQLTDPSNGTQIAAEIAAGRANLLTNVKMSIAKPSPVEIDSNVACGSSVLVTYDRTGTIIDGNVNANNINFYNTVFGGRRFGGMILYLCGTEEANAGAKVEWIDASITFTGGKVLPDMSNAFQRFEGDFKWRKKDGNMIYSKPVGIFS